MKKMIAPLYTFILTIIMVTAYPAIAQNKIIDEIIPIFKTGSSKDLVKYFNTTVELNMNGLQGDFSKNQAEVVVRDFFKKNPPTDFQIVHQGESGSNIKYYIAYYVSNEHNFRVLIKTKGPKDKPIIYGLEFKKD
ncbi:DUF4783 domain-containing protein [Anditalea andensis]|uniref:DUF4783 domain-containing protein n=1 Tax=Anditalea andensis TaxID=1048983 RepID=A0A074LHB1_9BACT|nr:DUF4783 domain-containing protein [Anditalea andensis]KEO73157.1 hypothetical protein EL17_12420 [Anditalea andensis]